MVRWRSVSEPVAGPLLGVSLMGPNLALPTAFIKHVFDVCRK
ncbi:hypothetical protein L833_1617 [Mycobacteroides abscessus MAB_091912_2446]|uniref:Uncharacterized protein n=1 Tax=Mycobacteroides abscessus MAB_091912_2446 TaxID=1335414 RepID=A0A829MK62_9MYCO|nr:hypothetical protein L833_1617 [Mycobacteroides abscessus MAB_091912_2446]